MDIKGHHSLLLWYKGKRSEIEWWLRLSATKKSFEFLRRNKVIRETARGWVIMTDFFLFIFFNLRKSKTYKQKLRSFIKTNVDFKAQPDWKRFVFIYLCFILVLAGSSLTVICAVRSSFKRQKRRLPQSHSHYSVSRYYGERTIQWLIDYFGETSTWKSVADGTL